MKYSRELNKLPPLKLAVALETLRTVEKGHKGEESCRLQYLWPLVVSVQSRAKQVQCHLCGAKPHF